MLVDPKVLVAGATGTNGRELVHQLTARGIAVRALVRNGALGAWDSPLIDIANGDLADLVSLRRALDGIDKAYIVTGIDPRAGDWFENFFAAAEASGVGHLIKVSGLGAHPGSPSEILRQHALADAALIASGLTYTILRPNAFFQNVLASQATIRGEHVLPGATGEARQSLVDVRDLAEATVRILTEPGHDNRIYRLTGPEALSGRDVARELSSVLGRPITYRPLQPAEAEAAMRAGGLGEWAAHAVAEIQAVFAGGAFAEPTPDLEQLLARPPRRFADFAREHAAAFR
jgi:uncharacterized protein YbjT (DUF2867 family)